MNCTHGLPYETKCPECVRAALHLVQTQQQNPPEQATDEERAEFYRQCYLGNTIPKDQDDA